MCLNGGIFTAGRADRASPAACYPPPPMTFFITSEGAGQGGNLGGLAGADAHCQKLATAVNAGNRTWRAYLSTQGPNAVNARDRIGSGPWHNAKGVLISQNVADLHGDVQRDRNNINSRNGLTEKGEMVIGSLQPGNRHDILTGSDSHGRAIPGDQDRTCSTWTSSSAIAGSAQIGHHDRLGGNTTSWNMAHATKGCSVEAMTPAGGAGLFYCFVAN